MSRALSRQLAREVGRREAAGVAGAVTAHGPSCACDWCQRPRSNLAARGLSTHALSGQFHHHVASDGRSGGLPAHGSNCACDWCQRPRSNGAVRGLSTRALSRQLSRRAAASERADSGARVAAHGPNCACDWCQRPIFKSVRRGVSTTTPPGAADIRRVVRADGGEAHAQHDAAAARAILRVRRLLYVVRASFLLDRRRAAV